MDANRVVLAEWWGIGGRTLTETEDGYTSSEGGCERQWLAWLGISRTSIIQ